MYARVQYSKSSKLSLFVIGVDEIYSTPSTNTMTVATSLDDLLSLSYLCVEVRGGVGVEPISNQENKRGGLFYLFLFHY